MSDQVVTPDSIEFEDGEFFDTYSFGVPERYILPDKKQWIEFKQLTEGDRLNYERMTTRDMSFNRKTDDARVKIDMGGDRHALISIAVTDWYIVFRDQKSGNYQPMAFSRTNLENWLKVAPPHIVDALWQKISDHNSWLGTENLTVEDIEKQIGELQEERNRLILRDAGKGE